MAEGGERTWCRAMDIMAMSKSKYEGEAKGVVVVVLLGGGGDRRSPWMACILSGGMLEVWARAL